MKLRSRNITKSYDPFLGDTDARDAANALQNGDWIPTMALLRDTADRSLRMTMITSEAVDTAAFETWVEAHATAQSLTMLAMRQMTEAWAIGRTKAGARTQKEIDDAFLAQLRVADRTVARACGKDPEFADAWAAAVPIATGLGLGVQAAAGRFERAHTLHPYHRNATIAMLRAKFARWGGSHEQMMEFARLVSDQTPPNSAMQMVLPFAHLEYVAAHGRKLSHFSRSENRDELKGVIIRFLDSSPDGPAPAEQLEALNTFVAVLGRMHPLPEDLLNKCIERIADRPTPVPWRRGENDLADAYAGFIRKLRKVPTK